VFIASSTVGPWQANCHVLHADRTTSAVVIDPGIDAAPMVTNTLAEHGWTLAGVLATHGHVDHIADAAALANRAGVPFWLHGGDAFMLARPSAGLGPESAPLLARLLGADELPAPDQFIDLSEQDTVEVAGLRLGVVPAPGHTPGCVLYRAEDDDGLVVWTGDVLFAGSIGRTDLPGGDPAAMRDSLGRILSTLPDGARLLPGHGPTTTLGRERATNPYLQPSFLEGTNL